MDSVEHIVTNLGPTVNTPYDEFSPIISSDGLVMIFTSTRPILKEAIAKKVQGFETVYISYYNDMTWKWSEAKMLGETINQPGRNNSPIALSNDGQRMLLYRGDPDGNIYESVLNGEEWSEPVKLPEPINSSKHESTASISPDGRTIYFVSNRKGGQGKLDIWLSHQDNTGTWGKAENLGATINTDDNEEGVFIHPDGKTLYFSSMGHNSSGGFDIFKSIFENGNWSTPVTLGNSINTPEDDLFFTLTADGKTGYYSTAYLGNVGSKEGTISKEKTATTDSLLRTILDAQILLEEQIKRVQNAKLVITDLKQEKAQQVIRETQVQLAQMALEVQKVIKEAQALLVVKEVLVNMGATGASSDTISIISTGRNNIAAAPMAATMREGGYGKKDIYEISFKNKKTESNLTLFKGVVMDFETLDPIGTDIEISDNDKNEIIANIQSNSATGKYLVSLPAGKNYGIAIKKQGYLFFSENFNIPESEAFKEINKNIQLQKFSVGNKINLKNVFYDQGKATLKPESLSEINRIVNLMNLNIDIKIEVASFTDSEGSTESNLALSQARSQSVLDFLFSAGISKDQVVAKGYGEANPIASNDTEEGRKLNRRTEIKILEQ
ncbi:MAG: OmpA family protein [Bacteroidota bacterium]|nr:OmpA family protein [Bacteroidota bacterium]